MPETTSKNLKKEPLVAFDVNDQINIYVLFKKQKLR